LNILKLFPKHKVNLSTNLGSSVLDIDGADEGYGEGLGVEAKVMMFNIKLFNGFDDPDGEVTILRLGAIMGEDVGFCETKLETSLKHCVEAKTPFILSMLSALNPFVPKFISGVITKSCSS